MIVTRDGRGHAWLHGSSAPSVGMPQQLFRSVNFPKPVSEGLESLALKQCWGALGELVIKGRRCLVENLFSGERRGSRGVMKGGRMRPWGPTGSQYRLNTASTTPWCD